MNLLEINEDNIQRLHPTWSKERVKEFISYLFRKAEKKSIYFNWSEFPWEADPEGGVCAIPDGMDTSYVECVRKQEGL